MVLAQGTKGISLRPQHPPPMGAGAGCTFYQECRKMGIRALVCAALSVLFLPHHLQLRTLTPGLQGPSSSRSPTVRAHLPPCHWLLFEVRNKKVKSDGLSENHFHCLSGLNYGS